MMDKVLRLLGLCQKAGVLASGEFACEQAIKAKKAFLLLIAQDASQNTKKKFKNSCDYYHIKYISCTDKAMLGKALGKEARAVAAVLEEGFAKKIIEILNKEL